jgi:hypothetical protein
VKYETGDLDTYNTIPQSVHVCGYERNFTPSRLHERISPLPQLILLSSPSFSSLMLLFSKIVNNGLKQTGRTFRQEFVANKERGGVIC